MRGARVFFLGGWLAYRGGLRMLRPAIYVPMFLLQPLAELLFFLQLGRYADTRAAVFYVIGNALYSCSMGSLFSLAVSIAIERYNNTLLTIMASPVNRLLLFTGRMVPAVALGLGTGLPTLAVGWGVAGVHAPSHQVPLILWSLVSADASMCVCGLVVGAAGLRVRDINFAAGLVLSLTLLLSGANIPIAEFPPAIRLLSSLTPMTLSIEAGRLAAASQPGTVGLLARQAGLTVGYLLVAGMLLHVFEANSRSAAALERS